MNTPIALQIEAKIDSRPLGEVPGGTRVDLTYVEDESRIVLFRQKGDDGKLHDRSGKIIAGHDWALLRDDAVIIFDGKVTFEVDVPSDTAPGQGDPVRVPMIAQITGRMDLHNLHDGKDRCPYEQKEAAEILLAWQRGALKGYRLPVGLFVQLTIDHGTKQGQSLLGLERMSFLGKGWYTFDEPLATIRLDCVPAVDVASGRAKTSRKSPPPAAASQAALPPAAALKAAASKGAPTKPVSRGYGKRGGQNGVQHGPVA